MASANGKTSGCATARFAQAHGASCAGDNGVLGHAGRKSSNTSNPAIAARFAPETGAGAVAKAVGTVHLHQERSICINEPTIGATG